MTLSSFGFRPDDLSSVQEAQENIDAINALWVEVYKGNVPRDGFEGTVLHQLAQDYLEEDTYPYSHLGSSAECCVNNLGLISALIDLYQNTGFHVPIWTIGSVSRSVLISACRILYVLLPTSPEERKANLLKIHNSNLKSRRRYERVSQNFITLSALHRSYEPSSLSTNSGISDTMMTELAVTYVIDNANLVAEHQSSTLKDYVAWMWNSWSGLAHGMEWPTSLPNLQGTRNSRLMPGNYSMDLLILSVLALKAVELCRDAFIGRPD